MSEVAATPVGAPAEAVATAPVDNFEVADINPEDTELNLDDLINADFGDDPAMQGTHKGIPDYKQILKHIPENGRKLVQNLRASYTQKTQEIADLRRQVEAERSELQRQRHLLSESDFAKQVRDQATREPQHDPWSDEGLQERINLQAAKMMQEMLTPLQQDLDSQRRQVALDSFKQQHPDISSPDLRVPIAELLISRPELKLEDAYFIVKGQVSRQQSEAVRKVQQETLKKTSTGTAVRNGAPPKFKDAWSAYQFHKANGGK